MNSVYFFIVLDFHPVFEEYILRVLVVGYVNQRKQESIGTPAENSDALSCCF